MLCHLDRFGKQEERGKVPTLEGASSHTQKGCLIHRWELIVLQNIGVHLLRKVYMSYFAAICDDGKTAEIAETDESGRIVILSALRIERGINKKTRFILTKKDEGRLLLQQPSALRNLRVRKIGCTDSSQ